MTTKSGGGSVARIDLGALTAKGSEPAERKLRFGNYEVTVRALGEERDTTVADILVAASPSHPETLFTLELLRQVEARRAEKDREKLETMIDSFAASLSSLAGATEADAQLARRNAELRHRFLRDHPCLTSAEVAEAASSRSGNAGQTAYRWKRRGLVFSVRHAGRELFPTFQFGEDGTPRPAVARVLAALGEIWSPWQIALWFASRTPWLDGDRPLDRLGDPEAVEQAARLAAQPAIG